MAQQKTLLIKLLLRGDTSTGKTSLLVRFVEGKFRQLTTRTVGADFLSKAFNNLSSAPVVAQIWDTAGQESLATGVSSFFRGTDAFGIVVTPDNLTNVRKYYDEFNEVRRASATTDEPVAPIYFIVNKTDLFPNLDESELKVAIRGLLPKEENQIPIVFCSAKENINVSSAFEAMVAGALDFVQQLEAQSPTKLEDSSDPSDSPSGPGFELKLGIWGIGNIALAIAAIVTIATLASIPTGGISLLAGLTVLGVAGIAVGAAVLAWNLVCFIANKIGGGEGGPPLEEMDDNPDNFSFDSEDEDEEDKKSKQPNPEPYQKFHSAPPDSTPTPDSTGQSPTDTNIQKKEM